MNNSTLVNAKIEKKGWPGSEQSLLVFHLIKYQLFRYTLKKKKKTNKQTKQNKAKTKKKKERQREKKKGFELGTFCTTRLHLTTTPLTKDDKVMLRKVLNLTPFPWNFRRQTPFKVYRAFDREKTGLLIVKKQCKRISW